MSLSRKEEDEEGDRQEGSGRDMGINEKNGIIMINRKIC
jgi:hypothetical protein